MRPGDRTESLAADRARRAAEALGLGPDASPADARAAFLRRLRDADCLPPLREHEAFHFLAGRPLALRSRLGAEVHRAEKDRLSAEIEAFARDLFAMPIPERRERWEQLIESCDGHDRLIDRLQRLKPGLKIDPAAVCDSSAGVERLARLACELFVLPSREAAIHRQAWLHELLDESGQQSVPWGKVVKRLRRRFPAIHALAPEFFAQLAPKRERPRRPTLWIKARSVKALEGPVKVDHWVAVSIALGVLLVILKEHHAHSQKPLPSVPMHPSVSGLVGETVFRVQMKKALAYGLAEFRKPLPEAQIDEIVKTLPLTFGVAILRLAGKYEDAEFDRDKQGLQDELSRHGVNLSEEQLVKLTKRLYPYLALKAQLGAKAVGSSRLFEPLKKPSSPEGVEPLRRALESGIPF
jgi:PAS domain-containing protein